MVVTNSSAPSEVQRTSSIRPSYLRILLPPTGAAITYGLSLHAAQIAGRACRVSCATFGWSSLLGCVAVSCSSLAAGQMSFAIQKYLTHGPGRLEDFIIPKDTAVFTVISGLIAFKVLGGRFQNLMPSDVRKRGALASFSIPATGSNQASPTQCKQLSEAFKRDGCHHCGGRTGKSIADHIPPNVIARSLETQSNRGFLSFLFPAPRPVTQRFFPQCVNCMKKQSAVLAHGKDPFVFHSKRGFPQPPYFAGFLIGTLNSEGSITAQLMQNWDQSQKDKN